MWVYSVTVTDSDFIHDLDYISVTFKSQEEVKKTIADNNPSYTNIEVEEPRKLYEYTAVLSARINPRNPN